MRNCSVPVHFPALPGVLLSAALLLFGSGCQPEEIRPPDRIPIRLEELTIAPAGTARSFFLSDRRGGFLVGEAGGGGKVSLSWSIDGEEILRAIGLTVDAASSDGGSAIGFRVIPDRFVISGAAGWEVSIAPVEDPMGGGHALALSLQGLRGAGVEVTFAPGTARGGSGRLTIGAGAGGDVQGMRVRCAGVDSLSIVAVSGGRFPGSTLAGMVKGLPASIRQRRERMESILERSYLRMSDRELTRAMAWLRLSLDALVVEGDRPSLAGSIPWDGSFDARENLRSFSGIILAGGEATLPGRVLDAWGARMDDRRTSATYGRIAGKVRGSSVSFNAIDAGGWFARALYDYVVASGDTSCSARFFPTIRAGIEGMKKNNLGPDTLIHHRPEETWSVPGRFRGAAGPITAVEIQSLWQTQQTIACIMAQSLHDTSAARTLAQGAVDAGVRFSSSFIDTARQRLCDFVDRQGRPVDGAGGSAMLVLESLEGERILSSLLKRSIPLLTPYGPRAAEGGDVAVWLTGPFAYALSRSDRQDLAAVVTHNLARHALEEGMVGTLPAGFAAPAESGGTFRPTPPAASLPGMAEFVRLVYQDYLGVRIDAPSLVIRFEPKLPPGLDSADFTLSLGNIPVRGMYVRGKETSRMTIAVGDLPRAAKWRFIWLFENGDGWMGAAHVAPGGTLTAVFGREDLSLYSGEERVQPEEMWFIRGLSRRHEYAELAIPGVTP